MGAVWDLELPAAEKFVLLAFADHADHNGENARPGIALIMKKCSLSERKVQECISVLKEAGYMIPQAHERGGRGHIPSYKICVVMGAQSAPINGVKGAQSAPIEEVKGADFVDKGCTDQQERVHKTPVKGAQKSDSYNRVPVSEPLGTISEPSYSARARKIKQDGTRLSDDFTVTDAMRSWATEKVPIIDVDLETEQFMDHHGSKGTRSGDWLASWRYWMRNAAKYASERPSMPHSARFGGDRPFVNDPPSTPPTPPRVVIPYDPTAIPKMLKSLEIAMQKTALSHTATGTVN